MSQYIAASEYAARRERLFAALPAGSLAIICSNPEVLRNGSDNTFSYRASSDILYLTGFTEANCLLVFDKTGIGSSSDKSQNRFVMFVQPHNPAEEIWHGKRAGVSGAANDFGADRAYKIGSAKMVLSRLAKKASAIYFKSGTNAKLDGVVASALAAKPMRHLDPHAIVAEQRLVKSAAELAIMRRSGQVGSVAHRAAMSHCLAGRSEFALKGVLEFVFATNGGVASYDTIVAAGVNGLCLHYPAGLSVLNDGDMVLIDAGSEIAGYASDISRTFPVSGRFTVAQKELYEVVLASQLAAIAAIKPGVTWGQLEKICEDVLVNGLNSLGFPMGKGGLSMSDVMPHGLGHWLGLDVHDVGKYRTRSLAKAANKRGKDVDRPFLAGMVLTIEPGVYLSLTDKRIPEPYRGICIRIEDNIEVTATGAYVQTDAPKSVQEIEEFMNYARNVRAECGENALGIYIKLED
ncbi:MAG: aminopeptidase P N-terminal domain-containing protein [Candidatus Obscuribacterales bacterium]